MPEEGTKSHRGLSPPYVCWDLNLGLLEEQPVLFLRAISPALLMLLTSNLK